MSSLIEATSVAEVRDKEANGVTIARLGVERMKAVFFLPAALSAL